MRNALICAGAMLVVLLLWPLVFGAGSAAIASDVAIRAPSTATMVIPEASAAVPSPKMSKPKAESCHQHYRRAQTSCAGGGQCEAATADAVDICEATGFWPA